MSETLYRVVANGYSGRHHIEPLADENRVDSYRPLCGIPSLGEARVKVGAALPIEELPLVVDCKRCQRAARKLRRVDAAPLPDREATT